MATSATCFAVSFGQAPLIFRRQNLAGHRGGGLHHQPADLAFELGEHAVVFLSGGFARLDHNLFGGRDGLLRFLLLQARGCGAGFLDELVAWAFACAITSWRCASVLASSAFICSALARP